MSLNALELLKLYKKLSAKRNQGQALSASESKQLLDLEHQIASLIDPTTSQAGPPRRQALRVETRLEVAIKSADEMKKCFIKNISGGGLYIETPQPPPIGTRLDLKLAIPGYNKVVETLVEVAWTMPNPSAEMQPGMGVKFISIDPAAKKQIQKLVDERVTTALSSKAEEPKKP